MSSWKSKQLPPGFAKFNFIITKFSSTLTWKTWYQQRLSGLWNVFWQGEIFESYYRRNRKILKKTSAALQKRKTTEKTDISAKLSFTTYLPFRTLVILTFYTKTTSPMVLTDSEKFRYLLVWVYSSIRKV